MKSDLYSAIAQIAGERGIPKEAVLSSVEHALKTVYKKMENTEEDVDVTIDATSGAIHVFLIKRVVSEIEDPLNDVLLPEALTLSPTAQVGDVLRIEIQATCFEKLRDDLKAALARGEYECEFSVIVR